MSVKVGQRVVLLLKGKELDAFALGIVQDPAHTTSDGDPALNLAYFDDTKQNVLGTPDWPGVFTKLDAVKHTDHSDVEDGKELVSWDYAYGDSEMSRIGQYITQNFHRDFRVGDTASLVISRLGDELKGFREGTRKRYNDGSTAMAPLGSEPLPDTSPESAKQAGLKPDNLLTVQDTRDKLAQGFVEQNKLVIPDGANLGDVLQFLEDVIVANDAKQLLGVVPNAPLPPSAQDLDAHAEELAAVEAAQSKGVVVSVTPVNTPPALATPGKDCETCGGPLVPTNGVDVPAGYVHVNEPEDGHEPSYGPDPIQPVGESASTSAGTSDDTAHAEAVMENEGAPPAEEPVTK